jgi:alkylated DNA repair dioxygenase AlkB
VAGVCQLIGEGLQPSNLLVFPGYADDSTLVPTVRRLVTYGPGEDRATGTLYEHERWWNAHFEALGRGLLDDLYVTLGQRFTILVFQGYRNGAGCDWHADTPFDAQAILSLGVTRTFGVRLIGGEPQWLKVHHGDLVYMPPGFQNGHEHCVLVEDVPGERISLVFRTVRS